MSKPFAPAADANRHAILPVLRVELKPGDRVLEIGSGTGQHAVFFGACLPEIRWQPSDVHSQLDGIRLWVEEAGLPNVLPPLELDLDAADWPVTSVEACYTANTLHILHWAQIIRLFESCARVLVSGGRLCVYGPMAFEGRQLSDSNARFDAMLKREDPERGVRDRADLDELAARVGFGPARVHRLPVNNCLLIWDFNDQTG